MKIVYRTRKLLKINAESGSNPSTSVDTPGSGVKLPKLDVPTFDDNILHWKFCTSVHDRSRLTDAEKLVYLQHSLKDGSEAVECLIETIRPRTFGAIL